MREILFRAKRIDNGEWAEGQYAFILNPLTESGEPIKHLICNGTNIFNDIVGAWSEGKTTVEVIGNILDNPELLKGE